MSKVPLYTHCSRLLKPEGRVRKREQKHKPNRRQCRSGADNAGCAVAGDDAGHSQPLRLALEAGSP